MAKRRRLATILLTFSTLFFASVSYAEVIVKCGPSKGYAYYYPSLYVSEEKAGWQIDGISTGSTTIVMVDGEPDVLYGDAIGGVFSSRAGGGSVTILGITDSMVVIGVSYPQKVVEVYTYNSEEQTLMLFQSRYGGSVIKTNLFLSHCE